VFESHAPARVHEDPTMDAGHLYAKYACLPSSELRATVEGDLTWARTHAHMADNLLRPLAARLGRDQQAVLMISDMLFSTTNSSVKASFPRLLAFSGNLTTERDAWCRKELEHQDSLEWPELGYDLLARRTRAVRVCLLESIGEALTVSEPLTIEE
jgi:hypothetical protein